MDIRDAKAKYRKHKATAKQRGIEWAFDFNEWCEVWQKSGKWDQRGKYSGQYCMARFGDIGPYSKNNVKIISNIVNHNEAHLGKPKPRGAEHSLNISRAKIGIPSPKRKITCPHCNLTGAANNMKRYHFDRCKSNTK